MRTIDADKACKAIENYRIKKDTYDSLMNEWDRGYNYGLDRAEAEIQDFIVEAIPVEWIQKWIAEHYDLDFVGRPKYIAAVEYMFEDWKAEQRKEEHAHK